MLVLQTTRLFFTALGVQESLIASELSEGLLLGGKLRGPSKCFAD